jgi:DNA-binding XRE family transcriptional regulator
MIFLFRFNKDGIAQSLIRFHDLVVKDTLKYFEKGKNIRWRIKQTQKAINKALKIVKKKERNPGVMIGTALQVLQELRGEVEYTRKALRTTHDNMEKTLDQIEKERIEEPIALILRARAFFEQKDFEKGIALLKESKEKAKKKVLLSTRTALFCGISGDVKDLKQEIKGVRKSNFLTRLRKNIPKPNEPDTEFDETFIVDGKAFKSGANISSAAITTIDHDSREGPY